MKVGQQVVAYRGYFSDAGVGIVERVIGRSIGVRFKDGFNFIRKTNLRYARISDVGVVCRVKRTKDSPFFFGFDDGQIIVRVDDNTFKNGVREWEGQTIYQFQEDDKITQWVHPSQVEIV